MCCYINLAISTPHGGTNNYIADCCYYSITNGGKMIRKKFQNPIIAAQSRGEIPFVWDRYLGHTMPKDKDFLGESDYISLESMIKNPSRRKKPIRSRDHRLHPLPFLRQLGLTCRAGCRTLRKFSGFLLGDWQELSYDQDPDAKHFATAFRQDPAGFSIFL